MRNREGWDDSGKDLRTARLNEAFQYIDDRFLDLVEQERRSGHKPGNRQGKRTSGTGKEPGSRRHTWAVLGAAAACFLVLLVLPAGVIAKDWLGLRSLLLPGMSGGQERGEEILAGYLESPGVQAAAQWNALLQEQDASCSNGKEEVGTKNAGTGNPGAGDPGDSTESFWPSAWTVYGVSDRELGEKLNDIAVRYGLLLHEGKSVITLEELEQIIGGRFLGGIQPGKGTEECILYEDGSFAFTGETALKGYGTVEFWFCRAGKRFLQENLPLAGSDGNYACKLYENAGGEPVLLVWNDQSALVLAEYTTWYVAVEMEPVPGHSPEAGLRELADRMDFTNIKYGAIPGVQGYVELPGEVEIGVSGYGDSPEAKALAEWQEFLDGYDVDGRVLEQAPCIFYAEGRNDWYQYNVYSYEMGEKLDEIARKYGLKLHTDMGIMEPEEMERQVGGSFLSEDCISYWGYMYEDGSFHMDGAAMVVPGQLTDFQLRRAVKGTLDEVALNVGRLEDYQEWQYLTEGGEWVLLVLGPYKAMVFGNFEECFVSVNVLSGTVDGITQENLQELAEKIRFRVLRKIQVPDLGQEP